MLIEISNGELLDKITILEIKLTKIKDKEKLYNIQKEFDTLSPLAHKLFKSNDGQLQNHYLELAKINGELWDIEDRIRDCEREKRFDKEFVELARSVYMTNDKRSEVKKIINISTSSGLVEEKSYKDYE
jgi:CRISPR/Cas system endoribonuclease Cas6 (RAMP superfamily)